MARNTKDCVPKTYRLVRELLVAIGDLQDGSYISDGMSVMSEADFFDAVRLARKRTYRAARRMDNFLRKHTQPLRVDD